MDPVIIVTAPHAMCNLALPERNCDRMAGYAATSLYQQIPYDKYLFFNSSITSSITSGLHLPDSHIFVSEYPRSTIDLNRFVSRETTFRRSLHDLFEDLHKLRPLHHSNYSPVFVLDIHSFPPGSIDDNEIDLLDEWTTHTDYVLDLENFLRSHGVYVGHYRGDGNDIMREARSYGFMSVLCEFNESLSHHRVNEITSLITEWLEIIV